MDDSGSSLSDAFSKSLFLVGISVLWHPYTDPFASSVLTAHFGHKYQLLTPGAPGAPWQAGPSLVTFLLAQALESLSFTFTLFLLSFLSLHPPSPPSWKHLHFNVTCYRQFLLGIEFWILLSELRCGCWCLSSVGKALVVFDISLLICNVPFPLVAFMVFSLVSAVWLWDGIIFDCYTWEVMIDRGGLLGLVTHTNYWGCRERRK